MKPFNPMPESLDDTGVNPNVVMPKGSPEGVFGDPSAASPNLSRQKEINKMARGIVTEEMLNKEILEEKIQQDISTAKNIKGKADAKTPKDFLKLLIAKGEYKEDIQIFGQTWTIRALNQGDIITAFNDITDFSSAVEGKVNAVLLSQISYSIDALNGISIYEWFSDEIKRNDFSTTEEYRLAVRRVIRRYFEKMPNSVIKEFDIAYGQVEARRNEAIAELKNS